MGKKRTSIAREQASKPKKRVENKTNGKGDWDVHAPNELITLTICGCPCSRRYLLHMQTYRLCGTSMLFHHLLL